MSGVIVVRAMPDELRNVATISRHRKSRLNAGDTGEPRLSVSLTDSLQTGVNWSLFTKDTQGFASTGQLAAGTTLSPTVGGAATALTGSAISGTPGASLSAASSNPGSMFGMAFQTSNFAAMLNFLESQGSVHVLSSPRIATLNNQKAVLKVGTTNFCHRHYDHHDSGGNHDDHADSSLQPFFSGISLDVTPRIDEIMKLFCTCTHRWGR
jgi:MSHA biogenesis protein MshL